MKRSQIALSVLLSATLAACSSERRVTPPLGAGTGGGGGAGGSDLFDAGGPSGPPPADAGGYCGNEFHQLIFDAPNIYFVFDVSGSMASPAGNGSTTRYQAVQQAAFNLLHKLGPLINVGAAAFPLNATDADNCHAGGQIMPMSPGDPLSDQLGPTTFAFSKATALSPFGGTPTAATLKALFPTIANLGKRTIAILATDGGPNCDSKASCGVDECIPNIEGQCDPKVNCCAPGGPGGPENCVDRQPTLDAITALAKAGVPVYVIGVPGSEYYEGVLNAMALAGGKPQLGAPYYYKVTDFGTLGAVLGTIAASQLSCTFVLADPPKETGFTNVYLDQTAVPYDDGNGWVWTSPKSIELRGKACQDLKTGQVSSVQIVSGCPTEAPK